MVKKAAHATPNRLLRAAREELCWTQQQVADRIGAPLSLNISRWENGIAFPSAYYVERLCQLFGKSVRELGLSQLAGQTQDEQTPSQTTSSDLVLHSLFEPAAVSSASADQHDRVHPHPDPGAWTLPYPRNLFFLGREEVLVQLRRQLLTGQSMALSGMGGVGKTHVAIEYAYRHARDYQAVFWTRADSRDALLAGYHEMAHALDLPRRDEQDQSAMVAAVKGWLGQHTSWLLILDNADELTLLPEFLPAPLRGHLLLTTRAQALGRLANRIEVGTLDPDTAALLLLRRAGLLALEAPLVQAEQVDRQAAVYLSRELGCLPLALDQAGAYLEETGCSLQQYLELYRSHRAELLHQRGGVVQDHPDSVATTWALAFASVESRSALAADLLRLCAVLHPDAIPEELFLQGAVHLGPALTALESAPLAFDQALAAIQSYSLLRRSSREQTLSIHRLVQAVLTDTMTNQERDQWAERAIAALDALFPEVRIEGWGQWDRCGRLLPHVLTVAMATPPQQHSLELASLLTRTADYLLQRAHYQQAEPLYQRALSISEQVLGVSHPQVAFPLNGLADVYREQGRYERAEPLYQRALHLWETFGQEYPDIPIPLNNLALLYHSQGNYQQAELLYQRALSICERKRGQEHPMLTSLLNNLALLYSEQGHYQQAEPLLQRALRLDEQAFGHEHPEVAFSLTNLADVYLEQGRFELAEPLLQRALSIREQTLGHEHLQVAFPLNSLADVYRELGLYELAEPLYHRALSICEQTLGHEHPQVAFPLTGLATLYREQGLYERAEPLYQRALTIRYQQRGAHHAETAESLHEFARLYELRNQQEQAHILYQQALAIREQRLGPEHPHTLDTRIRLLRSSGRSEEAAAWAGERSRTAEEASDARRPATTPSTPAKPSLAYPDGLTAREVDVLRLVAQGLSDAHIAERLIISPRTVNNHLTSLYSKIQVSSRAAATRYAFEHHLI